MPQRDVIFQCRIVGAELRGTNSDMKIGGGLRRNRGGVQRGGVRPPAPEATSSGLPSSGLPSSPWQRRPATAVIVKKKKSSSNGCNDSSNKEEEWEHNMERRATIQRLKEKVGCEKKILSQMSRQTKEEEQAMHKLYIGCTNTFCKGRRIQKKDKPPCSHK